jgi:hypothetical protein
MAHDLYSDKETLRLVRAFNKIGDPEVRRIIVAIAVAAAGGATVKIDEIEAGREAVLSALGPHLSS